MSDATTPTPHPRATYRLQLRPELDFAAAEGLVPYLSALGVSHVYLSPPFRARRGSTHGYDVTDHAAVNPELGGREGLLALSQRLREAGLGLIVDFVPNHMGIGQADNPWWLDVLEWGRRSRFAHHFDIDFEPAKQALRGKVLVPFLGDHYGAVLDRGELELRFEAEEGAFSVYYYEHRFPLTPPSYQALFRDSGSTALDGLLAELRGLDSESAGEVLGGRHLDHVDGLKARLRQLYVDDEQAHEAIDAAVAAFRENDPASRRRLHDLLEAQHFRLAYFRVAADEINYRRFFNINDLAGLRIEDPLVFQAVHRQVLGLVEQGAIDGLRIDHVDGLFDPGGYCRTLRRACRERGQTIYLVVEKILAEHEHLRQDWDVDGTTGYDFLAEVTGLLVDPRAEKPLRALYRRQTGERLDLDESIHRAKCETIDHQLSAELQVLANMLDRIGERNTHTRDFTLPSLRSALREIVASFPVYRTYVTPDGSPPELAPSELDRQGGASESDRRDIAWAVAKARKRTPAIDDSVFDFAERAMLTELGESLASDYDPVEVERFALKLQQYTGPVTAKAVEDTVFYRHPLLLCLADVGADPRHFGVSVAAFHHRQEQRAQHFPRTMLTVSTHDTKRGADARTRIAVLSEMVGAWAKMVTRLNRVTRSRRRDVDGLTTPTGRDRYLIYQAMIGSWPAEAVGRAPDPEVLDPFADRLVDYARKALREAKDHTSWARPQGAYEEAVEGFIRATLDARRPNKFLESFAPFASLVARLGMLNSLSQLVLTLTVPGVPDIYQGTEQWDLSLVDPDNRRLVDFDARARALEALPDDLPALDDWRDGRIKLWLMQRLLRLRAERPALFATGDYRPLQLEGACADHAIAFQRVGEAGTVTVIAGRLYADLVKDHAWPLGQAWDGTTLVTDAPLGQDLFTGRSAPAGRAPLAELLTALPVAVFVKPEPCHRE